MNKLLPSRIALLVFSLLLTGFSAYGQTGLVISQVYGGGGNTGATYTNDFIELYNPTSSSVDTSGLSIQYTSKTGTFTTGSNVVALPAAAIAPGHYYLIQAAKGTGGTTALPTPDASVTLSLSGTDGKVALVNSTSALGTNGCPLPNTNIIDFVGYGAADCAEGNAAAPVLSNTTAAIRTNPAVDTDNNAADFTAGTPNPHNSSYVTSTNISLSATGSANPATILAGNQAVLTITVIPGNNPPSTNIAVSADLSLIGGSKTQAFTANGDGTYSFTSTVTTTAVGNISLPVTVTDSEGDIASTSIAITVNQPAPQLTIGQIQGVKSTTAEVISPYAGQAVQTSGIVTAIASTGFMIQSPGTGDGNPMTPDGIFVYTGSGKVPTSVAVGNLMQVTGTLSTFPTLVNSHIPSTELEAPLTITQLATNQQLPAPIQLTATDLSPNGTIYQLTPYEGMRVSFASLTTASGTDGSLNETNEVYTSNGEFYAVVTGTPRPFRQPGIDLRDPVVDPTKQPAVFNDSPERLFVDSGFLAGSTPINLSTGAILPNVTGVLDFSDSYDDNYVPARLLIDPSYNTASIIPGMTIQPAPLPASGEFTVASFNIERFFNTNSADDLYYVPAGVNGYNGSSSKAIVSTGETFESEAVDVTANAYATRLTKLSLAIRTVLNTPDVVTLEEVENQSVANDIANQINTDAGIPGLYTAYSTDNSTYYTQDGTGISVGFLVKNTVDELGFTQFGQGETFTPTGSTTLTTLNDRPWLVLNAGVKRAAAKDYPVTVIVNHMKSLINVNSTTTGSTRQKKELQAEDIAKYIQTLQASGQHVISGGDFNAFEFSDGYTDTLATYTNTNVLPAAQVVQPGVAGLVTPPLIDMALLLPTDQRWSYQEYGDAQILDHMVITPDLVAGGAHLTYVHLNADFPLTSYSDPTTPARVSDHDAALGYFALPAPVLSATLTPASVSFGTNTVGVPSTGQVFTLTNTGEGTISITSVTATGDYAATSACGASLDTTTTTCTINVVLTATTAGTRTGMLTVVTSAGTYTSSLTATASTATSLFVTPTSISFPTTANYDTSTLPVTLTNPTNTPQQFATNGISVTGTVQGGSLGPPFSQSNNCGLFVGANSSCTINVSFNPQTNSLGLASGQLTIQTATPSAATLTVPISGSFTLISGNITGGNNSFPDTVVGTTSATQTYTLTATGTITVNGASFSSNNNWKVVSTTCAGQLTNNQSCSATVAFTPGSVGSLFSNLTFNAVGYQHGNGNFTEMLFGNGTAPAPPSISVSALTFSASAINTASPPQIVTVTNNSVIPFLITGQFGTVGGVGSGIFQTTAGTTCSPTVPLAIGTSCAFSIDFLPVVAGPATGSFTVSSAVSENTPNPYTVTSQIALSVTATPTATLTSSLNFGNIIGAAANTQVSTLTNSNQAPLLINSITVLGGYSQTNTCGTSLAISQSCMISVTLTPTTLGTQTGTLTATTNAVMPVLSTTLTGNVIPASPSASSGSITFPTTTINTASSSQMVTLTNKAIAPVIITGQLSAINPFQIISTTCSSTVPLAVNGTCTVSINFTPTATGEASAILATFAAGNATPTDIRLAGIGVAPVAPVLPTLSPATVNFPDTALGSSTQQTVTVTNNAAIAVPVSSVLATGDYTQTNTCGTSIAANGNCAITVTFTPTVAGPRSGTLTITTTGAAATVLTAALAGTGQTPDFTFGGPTGGTTFTVSAGAPATSVVFTFTPISGTSTMVTLTCTGPTPAPAGVTCTVPAAPFSVSGSTPIMETVTLTTTSRVAASGFAIGSWPRSPWVAASLLGLSGLLMLLVARSRRLGRVTLRIAGLLTLLLITCIPGTGCGGKNTPPPTTTGGTTTANPNGTPAGTYTYTVTATASSGTVPPQTITLIVQ